MQPSSVAVEDFISPFINLDSDFYAATNYNLMSCGIRKSMSQLTINTMCLLKDEQTFLANGHHMNDTWLIERECLKDRNFRKPSEAFINSNSTVKFAFIRDPFDRFISLYLDKCIRENLCYNCGDDMRCVVRNIHSGLQKYQNHREWRPKGSYIDYHAAPLSWNCNFDRDLSKWHLLMIGSDLEERRSSLLLLENILKRQGVSDELIQKIHNESLSGETDHSTHKSPLRIKAEQQVREDPVVRDLLHKIYLFDYIVFPFKKDRLDAKYQTSFWKIPE
uniref:Sulfotransfer_1 domain-containing protein n=1 Tax=Caenorhabditis tropicalis TaxID=1561998 RepID=A0A1I7T4V3_9PELO